MNARGHYGDTRRAVHLAGVLERPVISDAITTLARRAQQRAWQWFVERGTSSAWLYWTSADVSNEAIVALEPSEARQYLRRLADAAQVGFWAIVELGASAPKVVDVGIADASVAYLAGSPLVAAQRARERSSLNVGATLPREIGLVGHGVVLQNPHDPPDRWYSAYEVRWLRGYPLPEMPPLIDGYPVKVVIVDALPVAQSSL